MKPELFLGRLLRREVDTSSLLAYLIARDASPMQAFLNLSEPVTNVRVEVQDTAANRMDVVFDGSSSPVAVLEMKVSATEHGDQLKRYEDFASENGASLFIVDLELLGSKTPKGWKHVRLEDIFACWDTSDDVLARELGNAISTVFAGWREGGDRHFADLDAAMVTVVLRRVEARLKRFESRAGHTSSGQPSLTVCAPHPSGQTGARLCVDVRCTDKANLARGWAFRVGVQVGAFGEDGRVADRRLANDLAMKMRSAFQPGRFESVVNPERADDTQLLLSSKAPLKTPRDMDAQVSAWLTAIEEAGEAAAPRHPVFHHDGGRRLAAQYTLSTSLTADDLEQLVIRSLAYLTDAATVTS